MEEDNKRQMQLNEVWRVCRKIQGTIFKYGYDMLKEFCPYDPKNTGLVSESIFSSILGKYKSVVGLSDHEVRHVSDYFRLRDGRVAYRQFCDVVCKVDEKASEIDATNGLEWNDPLHVNIIPRPEDRRSLCLLLIKIAQTSHLPLLPYFQDYELVSKQAGCVTIAHFSRIMHFMKIPLSDADFLLLLKRYMKDAFLVNYVAFLNHIESIQNYLKDKNLLDSASEIVKNFPGKIIDLDLPAFPPIDGSGLGQSIFKNTCNHESYNRSECDIVFCVQNYIHQNRVRVCEFIEGFDHLRTGTVTKNQFERGLFNMGLGKFLSQKDLKLLCNRYVDTLDSNRVVWRRFVDEIDQVFTVKNLDKSPTLSVNSPPGHIKEMRRVGALNWMQATKEVRDICEEVLVRIQNRVRNRRLHLHPFFKNYDRLNSGHVRCKQAHQVFLTNGILLTNEEIEALYHRYGNELGFNYAKFLEEADPAEYAVAKFEPSSALKAKCDDQMDEKEPEVDSDEYIIKVLSNIKRQMITKNISIIDFLQDYDRHKENEILESDFRRGIDNASIKISEAEMKSLCRIFRSEKRGCCILYRDFWNSLNKVFVEMEAKTGENEFTAIPLLHLANPDCMECFLNFEERTLASHGLMKLARKPDEISNLKEVFQDFDRENCGTIRENQFLRALTVREMHHMISRREFESVFKCFGTQRGLHREFKYREFLNVLNILFESGQIRRTY